MITNLPNNINPNYLIEKEIKKRYGSKCPCCGETRTLLDCCGTVGIKGIDAYSYTTWYGKQKNKKKSISKWFKSLFEKPHHWEIIFYSCWTCGASWKTPAYPTDILAGDNLDEIWRKIEQCQSH